MKSNFRDNPGKSGRVDRSAISFNLQVQISLLELETPLLGSILIHHGLHNWQRS